jgi:hypothetical protein
LRSSQTASGSVACRNSSVARRIESLSLNPRVRIAASASSAL